jgi:hypothetical protein
MRTRLPVLFALLMTVFFSLPLLAQNNFFVQARENQIPLKGTRVTFPDKYQASAVDIAALKDFLSSLPAEQKALNRKQAPVMQLPMPDGSSARFRVWESSIMEPGLAAKYPEIRTFAGQGIDDPRATVRMDYNPYFGFNAQVLSPEGNVYIDPYAKGDASYSISYYSRDHKRTGTGFSCATTDDLPGITAARGQAGGICRGLELYTYRLALACTGEYATRVCLPAAPTVAATLAAMTTSVNRVDGVYEKELAVRLILISNTNLLVHLDAATDGYTNNNGLTMLTENQTQINSVIGEANYDIGHVFSTGGGGVATVACVCDNTIKARGVTGLTNPVGDDFDIDFVSHEIGHQFGARHSYNSTTGNCGGQRSSGTAYEPGGGTTIMAYAGICGINDIQPHSDAFFHSISFDEITGFLESDGICRNIIITGNTLPQITAMNNNGVSIPVNTPFTLTATATDADGDALTYSWEEWDVGTSTNWNAGATTTTAPLFKARIPKAAGSRTFPDIAVILAGYPADPPAAMDGLKGETLPAVTRPIKFRLTVRDNHGGVVTGGEGCQSEFSSTFQVNAVATSGPFLVNTPNGGESYAGGSSQIVTWNVAATNAAPVNCAAVKISLSTNGGWTFPIVLLNSTPNDGTQLITLPNTTSTTAKIKVEAVGNIFFDISNADFTLTTPVPGFDLDEPAPAVAACSGPPSVSLTLDILSVLGFTTPVTLSASGNPAGTSVNFSVNPAIPGNNTVVTLTNTNTLSYGSYIVTITGTSGSITHSRDLVFNIQPGGAGPAITLQPQPQQGCSGATATFNVTSPGALRYQWQVSTNGGTSFANILGATTSSLTVITSVAMNNNQYRVMTFGQCNFTTSNAATLTVLATPFIIEQPQDITLCIGGNASFTIVAGGTNISYQWQLSTNDGISFVPIAGATAATYTQNGVTAAMDNNQYRVVITGTCAPAAISDAGILTVISPATVSANPRDTTICESGIVTFTVAGDSPVELLYQWQVSTNGGASYSNITDGSVYSGTTTATLVITNVPATFNGNRYRAGLFNNSCTTPVSTTGAILTVNARPTVTLSASPVTNLLPGKTITLTATILPSATGFIISWYRNSTLLPGVIGTTYIVDSAEIGAYSVRIINPVTGCNNESQPLTIGATASDRLFIFPSPNNGRFTVSYFNSEGAATQQTITVYDSHGARIYSAKLPVAGPYTLHDINIRGVAGGLYLVVIGDANGKRLARGKVLVQ